MRNALGKGRTSAVKERYQEVRLKKKNWEHTAERKQSKEAFRLQSCLGKEQDLGAGAIKPSSVSFLLHLGKISPCVHSLYVTDFTSNAYIHHFNCLTEQSPSKS